MKAPGWKPTPPGPFPLTRRQARVEAYVELTGAAWVLTDARDPFRGVSETTIRLYELERDRLHAEYVAILAMVGPVDDLIGDSIDVGARFRDAV